MRRTVLLRGLVAAVVAVSLTSCGGDSSLSSDELADEGGALCSDVQAEIDDLDAPDDLVDFGDKAGRVADMVAGLSDDLDVLEVSDDDGADLDEVIGRLDDVEDALTKARRAAALGDTSVARDRWSEAQDWGDVEDVADGLDLDDCVLDLEGIQPPLDGSTPPSTDVTVPPVTEPPMTAPPVTDPPVTEPPATEPPSTDPLVTYPFTIFDPSVTLLTPDGYSWYPWSAADGTEFYDSLARSEFAAELIGVTVGDIGEDATGAYAMLAREFVWLDVVADTALATSLEDVYLTGVASSGPLKLGGITGVYYLEDDGTSGWVGHTDIYSIVLQFPAGVEPTGVGAAYVRANY